MFLLIKFGVVVAEKPHEIIKLQQLVPTLIVNLTYNSKGKVIIQALFITLKVQHGIFKRLVIKTFVYKM